MSDGINRACALFGRLRELEQSGMPCPADQILAEQLACSEEQLCDAFAFLLAAGLIDWHRIVAIRPPIYSAIDVKDEAA